MTMQINQRVPDFSLPDLDGNLVQSRDLRGRIVIVNFWSCECPHSERTDREIMAMLVQWGEDVALLPVAANSIESADMIGQVARMRRLPPVLLDKGHLVADLFDAETTPQVFVLDREGILRYSGAMDNASFRLRRPTRFYLDEAVEALLAGRLPEVGETPPYGCAIVREALE